MLRLDARGNIDPAWNPNPKTFGGEKYDTADSVQQTTDGGYVAVGHTQSFGAGEADVYLIKLDADGNLDPTWDPNPRTFGGAAYDWAESVQQTTDGGYIVAGGTRSLGAGSNDVLVLKLAPARHFLPGDCNADGSVQGISDAVFLLKYNFAGGTRPSCLAACDADGDGKVDGSVTDAVYLLSHFFRGGDPLVPPYPACGAGQLWTDGPLGCETEPECP